MIRTLSIALALGGLVAGPALATSITYVDAVFAGPNANTTLADGTAMNPVGDTGSLVNPEDYLSDGSDDTAPVKVEHWVERPRAAANGVGGGAPGTVFVGPPNFDSPGAVNVDVPVIKTTISGLAAGGLYNVYGYYWDRDRQGGNLDWDIQFGLSEAGLTTFPDPGLDAALSTFTNASMSFVDAGGVINLAQANLGTAVASAGGTIDVFVNDGPSTDRTWYDGVGYSLIPEPSSLALCLLAGLGFLARRR